MAEPASLLGLQSVTERIQEEAFREDPVARMAMEEALRERLTSQQQQVQQATGLTGAAQVQSADRSTAQVFAEAVTAQIEQRSLQRQQSLQLELGAQTQLAGLQQQQYEFDRQVQLQLQLQRMQEDAMMKAGIISGVAGIAGAAAGGS
jgi:hypothetical protein